MRERKREFGRLESHAFTPTFHNGILINEENMYHAIERHAH